MTEPNAPLVTVGDRYVLVERLASDDSREVWRGHDDLASRQVVVKVYDGDEAGDEAWRTRFGHAARRLAALAEPGIASVLDHDADEPPVWLVVANVAGTTLDAALEDSPLPASDALRIVGQTALALKTAHDAGITHGAVSARHVMLRPDGSATLIGFDLGGAHSPTEDLAAMRSLARQLLAAPSGGDSSAETQRFLDWLTGSKQAAPTDLGDIGRTALALAANASDGVMSDVRSVVPSPTTPTGGEARPAKRPWYDEGERKRVRNRLVALGAIVVVAGGVLLAIVDRNGGRVRVPNVVGLTLTAAQNELIQDGIRPQAANLTQAQGIVTAQSPLAGTEVKAGSVVTLTVGPAQ